MLNIGAKINEIEKKQSKCIMEKVKKAKSWFLKRLIISLIPEESDQEKKGEDKTEQYQEWENIVRILETLQRS